LPFVKACGDVETLYKEGFGGYLCYRKLIYHKKNLPYKKYSEFMKERG